MDSQTVAGDDDSQTAEISPTEMAKHSMSMSLQGILDKMNETVAEHGGKVEMKRADRGTGDIYDAEDKKMQMRRAEKDFRIKVSGQRIVVR